MYVGRLYGDARLERPELGEIKQGPPILRCEGDAVEEGEGGDGVVVEMWKLRRTLR